MANIYYLFGVCDIHFTRLSCIFQQEKMFDHFYGLAYAKSAALNNPIYQHVSYIPDVIKNAPTSVDDAFLLAIESKYNISIADLIHADRHLVRYDKNRRLQIASALIKLIIKELSDYKIDLVYAESIADFVSYFTSIYCRYHQKTFLYPITPGFSDGMFLTNRLDAGPLALEEKIYQAEKAIKEHHLDINPLRNKLNAYQAKKQQPSYAVPNSAFSLTNPNLFYKILNFKEIKTSLTYLISFYKNKDSFHYDRHPLLLPFYRAKKIINKRGYQQLLKKVGISLKETENLNYFIYPLHLHPEAATLIRGRWFNNQLSLIEMISKNLPADTYLLVKEHKVCIGRRPADFYRSILSHHNVLLVSEDISSYDLIPASKGIITISSSMGLEALLLKKPVISFGDRYYNVSNNVYCIKDYSDIRSIIAKALQHEFDHTNNFALFQVIYDSMITAPLYTPANCHPDVVQQLAKDIYQYYVTGCNS